jgi:hypothetical protein
LIGYCRTPRGPPIGRAELSGPASARPRTLRACTPAGRRHLSFRVHARLTPAVLFSPDPAHAWTNAVAIVPKLQSSLSPVRAPTLCQPVATTRMKLRRAPLSATARGARGPRFGTRAPAPMTPPSPERPSTPADLRTALRPPASFGVTLFAITVGCPADRPRTPSRLHSEDHIISQRFSPPSTGCISEGHTSLSFSW